MPSKLRTKTTEERGESIVLPARASLKKTQCSRTHLYNISTQQRKLLMCTRTALDEDLLAGAIFPRSPEAMVTWMLNFTLVLAGCFNKMKKEKEKCVTVGVGMFRWLCLPSHTYTHAPVCVFAQVFVWCLGWFAAPQRWIHKDGKKKKKTPATVSRIIFLGTRHIFLLWKLCCYQYKIEWKHCLSSQSQLSIHVQTRCSEL